MSEHSRVSITDEERRTVTGSELTDDIGIDDVEIQFQTAFTQFSTQDRARLERVIYVGASDIDHEEILETSQEAGARQ